MPYLTPKQLAYNKIFVKFQWAPGGGGAAADDGDGDDSDSSNYLLSYTHIHAHAFIFYLTAAYYFLVTPGSASFRR